MYIILHHHREVFFTCFFREITQIREFVCFHGIFVYIFFSGFIMEWEDSYPLNVLQMYPQEWVYSREEAARMVKVAEDCGLIVIPLVQTFGHLEYVLKHFTYLREHPERCDCLIPIGKYLLSRISFG